MEPNINRQDLTDVIQALQASIRQHENSERERRESIENLEKLSENMTPIPDRMESAARRMEVLLKNLQNVKIRHHFSGKARIFAVLILIAWLLVTLFAVLWYDTRKDNKRMAANDLKYRYLGFVITESIYHTDTLYLNDPDNFKWMVERLEARKKAIERAEIKVRNKEKEAEEAREYMRQLRGHDKKN